MVVVLVVGFAIDNIGVEKFVVFVVAVVVTMP